MVSTQYAADSVGRRTLAGLLHDLGGLFLGLEERLDALDAALSWGTWETLRAGLGRDQAQAERVMRRLAQAALSS